MKYFGMTSLFLILSGLIAGCTNNGGVTYSGNAPGWYESSYTGPFNNIITYGSYVIAAGNQGIFRSTNSGISWMPPDSTLPATNFSLAMEGNTFIAAGNGPYGAYISTDSGATWTKDDSGLTANGSGRYAPIISIAGYGPDIFAGVQGSGVYRATDPATIWTPANGGMRNASVFSFTFVGTRIFAGTGQGIYISSDNGRNWAPSGNGLTANNYNPGSIPPIVALTASRTEIYAGSQYGDVFVSKDYGNSWTDISSGLPNVKGGRVSLAVRDSCLVAGDSLGVYVTTNDGGSWKNITDNISNPGISSVVMTGEFLYVSSSDSTVWRRPL